MEENQSNNYKVIKKEWQSLIDETDDITHQFLMTLTDNEIERLVDIYYQYMLTDEKAKVFLNTTQVEDRLSKSLKKWLKDILSSSKNDLSELIIDQRKIGEIHARIGLPVDLVSRGARKIKYELFQLISSKTELSEKETRDAVLFSGLSIDLAIEAMTVAFTPSYQKIMHAQEQFRLLTVNDDMSVERERQLGALTDWENQFIYNIATEMPQEERVFLSNSEFGLWFSHKGQHIFRQSDLIEKIHLLINKIDDSIKTQFSTELGDTASRILHLRLLKQDIEQMKIIISSVFDDIVKSENGKDPLTKLLTRRFIPTIMRREISLSIRSGIPFSIALIDIDLFKKINDLYGHNVGDKTLKLFASWLHAHVRNSDYVFRYGGEEFLLLLVETTLSQANIIVERLHKFLTQQNIEVDMNTILKITISVGIAEFDNHPDYKILINKADKMLYQAKNEGRNCTRCWTNDAQITLDN